MNKTITYMKCVLLALLMTAATGAWAESGKCGTNANWELNGGKLTISGTGKMTSWMTSDKVPWNKYNSQITSVVIGDGVTSIGAYAFTGCGNLTSVSIPESVTEIQMNAFAITSLTEVTLPASLTTLGRDAFLKCMSLAKVTFLSATTKIVGSNTTLGNCSNLVIYAPTKNSTAYIFGNKYGIPVREIQVSTYSVTMAAGTKDAANWTIASGENSVLGSATDGLTGVKEGDAVTLTYGGTHKVLSVTAIVGDEDIKAYYKDFVKYEDLQVGDVLMNGIKILTNSKEKKLVFEGGRYYDNGESTDYALFGSMNPSFDISTDGAIKFTNTTVTPRKADGTAGNCWQVSGKDGDGNWLLVGVDMLETIGFYSLTPDATGTVWTLDAMPKGDVVLQVKYYPWSGNGTEDDPFLIETPEDLCALADHVNGSNTNYWGINVAPSHDCEGQWFKVTNDLDFSQAETVALHPTSTWDDQTSTESNFAGIATGANASFCGHFDGNGKIISGLRAHSGLFGFVGKSEIVNGELKDILGEVKGIILTNSRISDSLEVAGIVGNIYQGVITDCHVAHDVLLLVVGSTPTCVGGIMGRGVTADVAHCTSAATIAIKEGCPVSHAGGLIGYPGGKITNNLVVGADIPKMVNYSGTVFGQYSGLLQYNYYLGCTYDGKPNATGVGCDNDDLGYNRQDGATPGWQVTLPDDWTTTTTFHEYTIPAAVVETLSDAVKAQLPAPDENGNITVRLIGTDNSLDVTYGGTKKVLSVTAIVGDEDIKAYYKDEVKYEDLQVGDVLTNGISIRTNNAEKKLMFEKGSYFKDGEPNDNASYVYSNSFISIGTDGAIVCSDVTITPRKADGTAGNCWQVSGKDGDGNWLLVGVDMLETIGFYSLTPDATGTVWTLDAMPKGDVVLQVKYYPWSGNGTEDDPFLIETPEDLCALADHVNGSNTNYWGINVAPSHDCEGQWFKVTNDLDFSQAETVALHPTSTWDDQTSTESNFTRIGTGFLIPFCGHFDGNGKIISGIRTNAGALFGTVGKSENVNGKWKDTPGEVKGIILTNSRISGSLDVAGIAGDLTPGIITDCHVAHDVLLLVAGSDAKSVGGIVGVIQHENSDVRNCTSAATIVVKEGCTINQIGGLVGRASGIIDGNLVVGADIPKVGDNCGTVLGWGNISAQDNYYIGCTFDGRPNATDVGWGQNMEDKTTFDGAVAGWQVTLADGLTTTATFQEYTIPAAVVETLPDAVKAQLPAPDENGNITVSLISADNSIDITYSGDASTISGLTVADTDGNPVTDSYGNIVAAGQDAGDPHEFVFLMPEANIMVNVANSSTLTLVANGNGTVGFDGLDDSFDYHNSLTTQDEFNEMTIIDVNGTWENDPSFGTWQFSGGETFYQFYPRQASDDWLITPALEMKAGATYTIGFQARCSVPLAPESFEVKAGTALTADNLSAGAQVMAGTTVNSMSYTIYSGTFTPTADGTYYIGIHCTSRAKADCLFVKDLSVTSNLPAGVTPYVENGQTVEGKYRVVPGTEVPVLATADENYNVTRWTDADDAEYTTGIANSDFFITSPSDMFPAKSTLTLTMGSDDETAQAYFSMNGYLVTIPAGEYITYYREGEALTVVDDEVKLYTVTAVADATATITELGVAAAGTPLLVKNNGSQEKTVLLILTDATADAVTPYAGFKGTAAATTVAASSATTRNFTCNGLQFVAVRSDLDISANKCWLEVGATNNARQLKIVVGDATGVSVVSGLPADSGTWYDLSGRRVAKPAKKGVYILNGKKVVVK